jgi:hypothetical protein
MNFLDGKMTLETAKRFVLEQGKYANKEAQAVVRGGMTICEQSADGRRSYPWIKVFPTKTDDESSIDLAIKEYRMKKELRNWKNRKEEQISSPIPVLQQILVIPQIIEPEQKESNPLSSIVSKIKKRFDEFVKIMDGIVEE